MPVQRTDEAIKNTANEIRKLLADHTERDCMVRYKVGVKARDLDKKYGSNTIGRLATELGVDDSTLRSYADVARTWPKEPEFKKLSSKKTSKGLPLGFSSFELLASLEDKRERTQLLQRAIDESLSWRGLKAAIADLDDVDDDAEGEDHHDEDDGMVTSVNAVMALSALISSHDEKLDEQTRLKEAFEQLSTVKSTKIVADQIKKAVTCFRNLGAAYDANVELLEEQLQRVEKDLKI